MKERKILIILVLIVILLSACQKQTADDQPYELTTVTINTSTQINYAPIYFAETEGYFEEYGIQLEGISFARLPEAVPLLVSGQLDVYAGPITTGLLNVFGQEPYVKAVADRGRMAEGSCTFQALLVRKDLYDSGEVRGPADLAGKTIASTTSATKGYQLYYYLALAGLTFDDVNVSDLPQTSYLDAFENKAVDLIITPETFLTRLMMQGNAVILSTAEEGIGPLQSSIIAFGPRLINDDPELGARFMAAYLKGVQKYNEGKTEENLALLVEKTGEALDLLEQACWVPIREDGWIDFDEVDPFQQWSKQMGQLDETITEEQFWDPSFIEEGMDLIAKGK